VIRGENAPAGWGRPLVMLLFTSSGYARQSCACGATVWWISGTLKGHVILGALGLQASDAGEYILPRGEIMLHY
jgi:hypothetical protein